MRGTWFGWVVYLRWVLVVVYLLLRVVRLGLCICVLLMML